MIEHHFRQGSDEWLRARLGKPTASRFHWIFSPVRRKPSSRAHLYHLELLDEWVHGVREEPYQNEWTRRGQQLEPQARLIYSLETGNEVREVGFVERDDGKCGCSPDGLVGSDTCLEIKCYSPQVHALGKNPSHHVGQCQGELYVCERERTHLWSYLPGGESRLRVIERDEDYLRAFVPVLDQFIEELEAAKAQVEHCRL